MASSEQLSKFNSLVNDIRECMLVTNDPDEGLRSRPMACAKVEGAQLWFFTRKSSEKVQEIYNDREVNCAFAKPSDKSYLSVSGNASVIDDLEKKKELYSPFMSAWFDGPEDPTAVLLCVTATSAEYWDDNASTVITFAKIAIAAATGNQYSGGDNEKMSFS